MTIAEVLEARKRAARGPLRDALILSVIALASTFSFGLGYLAGLDAAREDAFELTASPLPATSAKGQVVASKSGMKYFLPWCAGVERISDTNKVWFESTAAAAAAGYAPAANCKGL